MKKKGDIRLSDAIKEQVKVLTAQGHSIRDISKRLNINFKSVMKIQREIDNIDMEQLRNIEKGKIIKKYWNKVLMALDSITEEKIKKMSAYQMMTTAAIGTDKAQLLSGEVTDRLEVKTESELNQELEELQVAEKELKEAWKRAMKKQKKAAEEGNGGRPEN